MDPAFQMVSDTEPVMLVLATWSNYFEVLPSGSHCAGVEPLSILFGSGDLWTLFTFCRFWPLLSFCVKCRVELLFTLCWCWKLLLLCKAVDPWFTFWINKCLPLFILCVSVNLLLTFVLVLILDPLFFCSYFCMCWPFGYFVLHLFLCISVTSFPRPACVDPFSILCVE